MRSTGGTTDLAVSSALFLCKRAKVGSSAVDAGRECLRGRVEGRIDVDEGSRAGGFGGSAESAIIFICVLASQFKLLLR